MASMSLDEKDEFLSAVGGGNIVLISLYIRRYPETWKEATNTHGKSAVHISRKAKITKLLISAGGDIEVLDKEGMTPFLHAVWNGNSKVMDFLIGRGCNISAKTFSGNGALALASGKGHLNIVKKLVRMGFSVNELHHNDLAALHLACREGHNNTAQFLISAEADIEALDKWGITPFLRAVTKGHLKIMNVLIRSNCDISAKNNRGNGALALASKYGRLAIARRLVEMGCKVNKFDEDGRTSLHWACLNGHAEMAEFLISSGAKIEVVDKAGFTPFLCAVSGGYSGVANVLIWRRCNILAKTDNGNGALAVASRKGHLDMAKLLVRKKLSVNEPHQNGYTSLHFACQEGHGQTVKFLISSGANKEAVDKIGFTPFLCAVFNGRLKIMDVLTKSGCNPFAKLSDGADALSIASAEGQLESAKQLLRMGFSVNKSNHEGKTSLHWACLKGQAKIADFLISSGALIEAVDRDGYTPFLRSVYNGCSETMNVLINYSCKLSAKCNDGKEALILSIQKSHFDITKKLVEIGCSIDEPDHVGCNALHWACQEGHVETVKLLISSGADIEALDKWGWTPFLRAVSIGNLNVVAALIHRDCNIFAKDKNGDGALALSSLMGHLNITKQLVGMGLSVNERHKNGFTCLHLACQEGHVQIAKYLISAGANEKANNKFGRTPLLEADFNKQYTVVAALRQNKKEFCQSEADGSFSEAGYAILAEEERWIESNGNRRSRRNDDRSQKIYDEALKRGSVTANRSRVIVAGQDGAGKSCLVDSLLNRPFENNKASTEGAAVEMTHTSTRGWVATDSKDHLDPLIAQGVYRSMNRKFSTWKSSQESFSELSDDFTKSSNDLAEDIDSESENESERLTNPFTGLDTGEPVELVESLAEDLKAVGFEAKTLTANQQQLVTTFLANKPSEEELKRSKGVRDIWDLGGQEVYLATHSALMPDSGGFGLSVYMVVIDISKALSDKAESFHRSSDGEVIDQQNDLGWIRTNGDFPLYWFSSITSAHEEMTMGEHWLGKDEEVAPPPVFVIASHRDVLDSDKETFPDSVSVEKWLKKQGKLFEQLISDSDFLKHIVVPNRHGDRKDFKEMSHFFKRIFLIDNTVSGSGCPCKSVKEIRERVDRMTTTYWNKRKEQPLFWVYLEILLFRWSKVMKTVLAKVDEIAKLAQHPKICNISSREEVLVALKYLANVGAILYYPEIDGLKDVVFTEPKWVIKALSAFVTAAEPGPMMMPKWNTLKEKGIMSNDLMNYRLKQMRDKCSDLTGIDPDSIEEENKPILRLLKLLDVITPVSESPQSDFYVPSMLKTSLLYPSTCWKRLTLSDSPCDSIPAPLIVVPTKLKFVPECIFFRLITRFLRIYPNRPRLSRHQCVFLVRDENSHVEVEVELLYQARGKWVALTIHFINDEEKAKKKGDKFLPSIKNQFSQHLKSVCRQGTKGFKYCICCQIKKAVCIDKEFGIDFNTLPVIDEEDSPIFSNFYSPFDVPLPVKQEEFLRINCWFERPPVNTTDNRLSCQDALPKVIDGYLIRAVATLAKAKWEQLAVFLGKQASDISQYQEKSKDYFVRALLVIEDWNKENGREATANALIRACEKCGIHRDNIEAACKEQSLGSQGQSLPSPSSSPATRRKTSCGGKRRLPFWLSCIHFD